MLRKRIAVLLAGIITVTSLVGCSKTESSSDAGLKVDTEGKTADELLVEKYEEPVKIRVVLGHRDSENPDTPASVTPQTQTAVKKLKEELNIELEYDWIVAADQYDQKFGAELAAGRLPDIMILKPNQFQDLQEQGALRDITEAYEKFSNENVNKIVNHDGKVLDVCKVDGKLYGIYDGYFAGQNTSQMYYDMNKLKDVGITDISQLPKTIAEFEALCDKIYATDIDKDGKVGEPVIPAGKALQTGLSDFGVVFQAYEANPKGWYENSKGELNAGVTDPNMKAALEKLNEWYKKGYFQKDFAATDAMLSDSKVMTDLVAGNYAVVPGSWWIANWPLNLHKQNDPNADWVVGPTLSVDGELPELLVDRTTINQVIAVNKDFEHPEALFKMINWAVDYMAEINDPEYKANRTQDQKIEDDSFVYHWLPFKTFATMTLQENYDFIKKADEEGKTEVKPEEALKNAEFWGVWDTYQKVKNGDKDPNVWGNYMSRVSPNGGVANMLELYNNADKKFNEVYVTTPTMVKKQGELDKFVNTTFLSMIMGEIPLSDFDKFAQDWNNMGGKDIKTEVNEWFKSK